VKSRVAAIVLRGDAVLLVRRIRAGQEEYVLPGGPVADSETAEQACVRELRDGAGLSGEIDDALWVLEDDDGTERYFLMGPVTGMASPSSDDYDLVWTDVRKLSGLNLQPTLIRDQLAACV
jgi:8-oxo-dGTP diphosphatase